MAAMRRRSRETLCESEEDQEGPSPKFQRLSNGSKRSCSSTPLTAGSPVTDMDECEEDEQPDLGVTLQTGSKGKEKAGLHLEGGESEGITGNMADDMAEKSRRMTAICMQQQEEDRQLTRKGTGTDTSAPTGKENEGVPARASGLKSKAAALSSKAEKKSEAGIVLRIFIQNFMCHKKLRVKFCRNVNFISGRNGSGKSAVLAALQICLGANANSTHRAKKLSDFIRHGWKGDATLDVTLLNTPDGFKYDEYGQSITIRRTIKQPSGGGFELISHDGEVKSKAKDELIRMLDVLNIQVDNPCAVLDQENSKKFLQGSERDKYAFFMKATDLDRILADSETTGLEISKMKVGHHQAVEQLPRYRNIVAQLRQELREYESLEDLERKINALKEKMAWKFVEDAENEVEELEEGLKMKGLEINGFSAKISKFEEELAHLMAKKEEIKTRLDEGVAEANTLKDEVIKADTELSAAQEPLLDLRNQRSSLQLEQRGKQGRAGADRALKEAREKARRNASDEKEKRLLDQLHEVEQKLAQNKGLEEKGISDEKMLELRLDLKKHTDAADRTRHEFQQQQQELLARQNDLRSLSSERFNPLTALGGFMPSLVHFISQHASEFQIRPVGPIGAYVQLKEDCKKHRVSIEAHIKKALNNFIVSNQRDKATLLKLMKACRGGGHWSIPTIIVQPLGPRYTIPENPPGFLQIMQAINVTNDQAFNALVDQTAMEKTCLYPSKNSAENACLVGSSGRYQRMPHGMYEAYYSSLGGKSCSKFSVVDGNIQTRMNVINPDRHRRVLGIDEGTQRQEAETQILVARREVDRRKDLADQAARAVRRAKEAFDEAEHHRVILLRQGKDFMRRKQKIESELLAVQATKNSDDPTDHLERCLEEATEELDNVNKDLATLEGHIREVTAQIDPLKQARANAKRAHTEATLRCKMLSEKFEEEGSAEVTHHHKIGRAKGRLAKVLLDEQCDLEKTKEGADLKLKEFTAKAEMFMTNIKAKQGLEWDGSRPTSSSTLDRLREKANVMTNRLNEERQKRQLKGKSKGEVESQLAQAVKIFKEKDHLAKQLEDNMKILAKERKERTEKWTHLRNYMAQMTSLYFNRYLQEKGCSGEVRFNYNDHTLGLTFQKDNSNDSQCNDVKLLSGGERSFATLALLLALGVGHECPFRVMDEFDVFMDAQSRNVAIKQVMTFAKQESSRQFILITPQDLQSVTASDTVKIIKMTPPRKGDHNQATLEEAFAPRGGSSA
ncbi:unnamed protein product [Ascophyllum nodosum]